MTARSRHRARPSVLLAAWLTACGSPGDIITPPSPPPITPVVSAVTPGNVGRGTTRDLHVTGTGFETGVRIDFTRTAVELGLASTVLSVSTAEVVVRVTVSPTTPIATFNVVATNPSGKSGTGNGLLLVDQVAAYELEAPSLGGTVTVVRPTGVAFGAVAGGCQPGDFGVPVQWDEAGHSTPLSAPAGAGCSLSPLREAGGSLYGRGIASDPNASNSAVIWPAVGAVQVFNPAQPPFGIRFVFDAVGPQGLFLAHANDAVPTVHRVPFTWTNASGWQPVQMLAGFQSCVPKDASPSGELVAQCFDPGSDQAAYWTDAGAAPITLPLPPGYTAGAALGINAAHVIVGVAFGAPFRAVRWTPTGGGWTVELLADLGSGSQALQINDAGWISGISGTDAQGRAVLWSPSGTMQTLSRLESDQFCAPTSIAVSTSATIPVVGGRCLRQGSFRPVVWRN